MQKLKVLKIENMGEDGTPRTTYITNTRTMRVLDIPAASNIYK